jgi:enediyne biosynthesis protein E5
MTKIDSWANAQRLGGLRRFAGAITILNIVGHTFLGFEQPWVQPLASLMTAYVCELLAEWMESGVEGRKPRFMAGWRELVDFLLPAHITGLAVAMLLYSSDNVLPIVFATAVAVASKATIRMSVGGRKRHFLNPSNFGIATTLLLFPWVSIAPPYHFSENLRGSGLWILPLVICVSGTLINYRFTKRICVVLGWWSGFIGQAVIRSVAFGTPLTAALNPMTGVAFILFSFYMVTDPATTPFDRKRQILFGFAVAVGYGVLVCLHVAFGFFFALTAVSAGRGIAEHLAKLHWAAHGVALPSRSPAAVPTLPETASNFIAMSKKM